MTPPKPSYKRGDVVLVLFPNSNLRTAELRPALVVQADNLATVAESGIDRTIGSIPMAQVDEALRHTLEL
jgi:mRNA-degrading endonuclease toxin of MazEF toxin-antitoxin module